MTEWIFVAHFEHCGLMNTSALTALLLSKYGTMAMKKFLKKVKKVLDKFQKLCYN